MGKGNKKMFPPIRLARRVVFMTFQTATTSLFPPLAGERRDSANGNMYSRNFCFCQDNSVATANSQPAGRAEAGGTFSDLALIAIAVVFGISAPAVMAGLVPAIQGVAAMRASYFLRL